MKPKMPKWWQKSIEVAQMRSFGKRIKSGLIGIGFVSAIGLTAMMWSGCNGGNACDTCIDRCQQENPGISRPDCAESIGCKPHCNP